ncbi:ABC transporter substrate-binding protein [Thermopolyspora sp. NPDC052614]|uniref:ABC transporter substrate-binding protein n=1 Tax=Thermopolyspora sp. NPDC052614 TaxID=3155682 RepID=UPI0034376653
MVTGCSGAKENPSAGLERTQLTVGTIPVVDTAPLEIAVRRGLFKAEGLDVKLKVVAGGAEAIPLMRSGELQISIGAYVPYFNMVATKQADLKIVAEGSQSAPGTHLIVVPPDSPIRTPQDLKGKKIAVNTKYSVASMLVRVAAKAYGVTLDEERNFVETPFPQMQAALTSKKVDAAQVVEPFGTQIAQATGARVIWDTSQAATKEFPISGYAALTDFVTKNPKTVAAFQRALAKGQALATDRATLIATIPQFTQISPELANNVAIVNFPTSVNATRLQRVADTMREYDLLKDDLDVAKMIVAPIPTTSR